MKTIFLFIITFAYILGESLPSQNQDFTKSLKNICSIRATMAKEPNCDNIASAVAQRLRSADCLDDSFLYDSCKDECETVLQAKKAKKK